MAGETRAEEIRSTGLRGSWNVDGRTQRALSTGDNHVDGGSIVSPLTPLFWGGRGELFSIFVDPDLPSPPPTPA